MNQEEKIIQLENEILHLKTQLNKYSNLHKKYYENHKDIVIEKANERLKKIKEENPDKIKEYAKRAYLKQKEKKQKQQNDCI